MHTPILSSKDPRHSASEKNFLPQEQLSQYLTIKVHEAKIFLNVAFLGGKMETYTKVLFQNQVWKTSVDKISHQTPKWNESKTFDITMQRNQTSNRLKEQPAIQVFVYHSAFFQDTEIGNVQISLEEIHRVGFVSEVFSLSSKKEQDVGQIYLSISLSDSIDEAHDLSVASGRTRTKDSSYYRGDSRLMTEPAMRHQNSRFNRDSQDQSNFLTKNSIQRNLNPILSVERSQSTNNFQHYFSQPRFQSTSSKINEKGQKSYDTESQRKNNQAKGGGDDRDAFVGNTLVTYHNDDEESIAGEERDQYNNFFNVRSRSDIHNFFGKSDDEDTDSDCTEGEIDLQQLDEGYKRIRTYNYDKDTSDDLNELQKVLESVKKDNAEVKQREEELKNKITNLKETYNKILKEKENIAKSEKSLIQRENCWKNERRNLSEEMENFKNEQVSFREGIYELEELKKTLTQVKHQEEAEKERTFTLEGKIKELAKLINDENQRLRELENTVISQRFNQIIVHHNSQQGSVV